MMKKRILFVVPTLKNGGGTIRSLQNLLFQFKGEYDIDVQPMFYSPNNIVTLDNCNVLPYQAPLLALGTSIKSLKSLNKKKIFFSVLITKIVIVIARKARLLDKILPLLSKKTVGKINREEYDSIIAFQEGLPTLFCSYIKKTKNKVAWIHSNYEEYKKIVKADELNIYQNYNKIICVSGFTKNVFINIYPLLKTRTDYIYNTLDEEYIRLKSKEEINDNRFDRGDFTIISIGRIDVVKQFSKLPEIASKLKQRNLKFKWYILGDGDQDELNKIHKNILQYGVEDCFFYLGSKFNPYPYIANSNLLVSSSLSEACPYVVNEAKILGVPVVSTNYGSSYEFIEDGNNGFITTIEEMDLTISQIINNPVLYKKLRSNLSTIVYNNDIYIKQIHEIL